MPEFDMVRRMQSLTTGKTGTARRDTQAMRELQDAYRRLFFDRGATPEDQQVVIADLASFTGYFFAQSPESASDSLRDANAMRRVFARIVRLGLSENSDLSALYRAAVAETLADREEGRGL
jgi:hypothetical protein